MDLNTVSEVVRPRRRESLADWRAGDAWLAGGTWLFSEPQPAVRRLVDLDGAADRHGEPPGWLVRTDHHGLDRSAAAARVPGCAVGRRAAGTDRRGGPRLALSGGRARDARVPQAHDLPVCRGDPARAS